MKFSEISKKLGVALLTGAVVVSMAGMNVSAEGAPAGVQSGNSLTSVTVNKTVNTKEKTYKPNAKFNFNVAVGEVGEGEKFEGNVVYAGPTDGLKPATEAEFSPVAGETLTTTYTAQGSLSIDITKFEKAGVYKYTVSEVQGTYDGMTYDPDKYDVYVYVYADETEALSVKNVVSVKGGQKTDLGFTNEYGTGTGDKGLYNIEIKKVITGDQANKAQTFDFTAKVNGSDAGEIYNVEVNGDKVPVENLLKGDNQPQTYTITNDGIIKIYGLSSKDAYNVMEQANDQGYVVSISSTDNNTNIDGSTASGTLTKDTTVTFTNTKNAQPITGVIMNIAPYALMVALAGVLAFFFLRRRHSEI